MEHRAVGTMLSKYQKLVEAKPHRDCPTIFVWPFILRDQDDNYEHIYLIDGHILPGIRSIELRGLSAGTVSNYSGM